MAFLHSAPMAFAHRGFSLGGLENTLTAFRAAAELGFTHMETDVRATRDGELVAFHDDRLDRVTDRAGVLAELEWAEVAAARIGDPGGTAERIPLFAELAEELPDAYFNVDVKEAGAVVPFAAVIERMRLHERVLVTSFSDARRRAVLARSLRDVQALQVPERYRGVRVVTPPFVARAHRLGLQVHVWTVNEPADMERLLALGVDGLVTDRADLLRSVLEGRGEWPPAVA